MIHLAEILNTLAIAVFVICQVFIGWVLKRGVREILRLGEVQASIANALGAKSPPSGLVARVLQLEHRQRTLEEHIKTVEQHLRTVRAHLRGEVDTLKPTVDELLDKARAEFRQQQEEDEAQAAAEALTAGTDTEPEA